MAANIFSDRLAEMPFTSYEDYINSLFLCADEMLTAYLSNMKSIFIAADGSVKNVLYPDLQLACDLCDKQLSDHKRLLSITNAEDTEETQLQAGDLLSGDDTQQDANVEDDNADTDDEESFDDLFADLFSDFAAASASASEVNEEEQSDFSIEEKIAFINHRAELTDTSEIKMPFYYLIKTLGFSEFSVFAFICAILASTQTSYGSVYQVINQNGNLSAPTLESVGKVYYANNFSISRCFGDMSASLDQLKPVIPMDINPSMPFSTTLTVDKRLIDYLFGSVSDKLDEKFERFCTNLIDDKELDPFLANQDKLDGLGISYDAGTRVFSMFGDEGSGRKFTIKHFCRNRGFGCISVNGGKLFNYDMRFVESALWSITRESIFSNACVVLDNLDFREDEKDKFFGYMDLSITLLSKYCAGIFTLSEFKLPLREFTTKKFAEFELVTPNVGEREVIWKHYAKGYEFADDVDLTDIATKFLFTAGKIKNSIASGQSISLINKEPKITKKWLFEACYGQMKHELTQKATKVKATYTWDDIIMPPEQRQSLEYACHQMRYRKQVYEKWDYNSKYPYGRGLSVLLFGHPGTGKTMCAQVLANALNLELYRVDLSKVIDKYVGETEKSISMIFREAKKCNVVLFFDECDTLFGKRTDSGGSGESANNNKTAHLLQEVEAYDGVTVLATNFKHNIDPAFFRRMKFIVEFAFPDVETRYNIWKATIPKKVPLAEDVDLHFLAEKFEFVGGNIKNCILNAGFFAAADGDGEEMGMKHLLMAIKYELIKTGKVFTRSDFEPYASLIL
ncbi:MAG: ATP-binding protein [Clostridia bacterium]|nr:ATP-binding protein [Clostridia bacterium]